MVVRHFRVISENMQMLFCALMLCRCSVMSLSFLGAPCRAVAWIREGQWWQNTAIVTTVAFP